LKQRVRFFFANFEEIICVVLLISIYLILLTHVILRYLFGRPIAWSEEVSRYFFVWGTFLGASVALKRRAHVSVEYFVSFLPVKWRAYLKLGIDLAVFVFLILVGRLGVELALKTYTIETAALGWPWTYVYGALPVGSFFMLITLSRFIWQDIGKIRQGRYEQLSSIPDGLI
jgi:TRAP-type C4-dicarboxylate transport system permease small subunit